MKNLYLSGVLAAFAVVAHSQIGKSFNPGDASSTAAKPSTAAVSSAITMAGEYLEHATSPDGRFAYRVDVQTETEAPLYNVVRHAGAMYALGEFDRAHRDPQVANALVRSAAFLINQFVGPGPCQVCLTVWSRPKPLKSDADLGATGLALVALAEANAARPGDVPVATMEALGRFLLFMQKSDGSFYSRYRRTTGYDPKWNSLYYPGEAALGLIALYETDHSKVWLFAAAEALKYLANSRAGLADKDVPPDHWALIATAKLLPYCAEEACPASREALIHHAEQVCRSLLHGQLVHPSKQGLDGSFDATGRTAPTATRMEGILAALEFLPERKDAKLRGQIEDAANHGIAFLLRAQIPSGPLAGGMPGAVFGKSAARTEVRIDFVQHALCAWLRYQRQSGLAQSRPVTPESRQSIEFRPALGNRE